jgi:2-oxoglutarate ferredoxin oxidoreductase subunit alpha
MARVESDLDPGAGVLVLSYGVTSRAAREAVLRARSLGVRASFLGVQSLFPVPVDEIRAAAANVTRVVVAEENQSGLYRMILASTLRDVELIGVNKLGGMIRPAEIVEAL